jgi:hypothetical protein
MPLKSTLQGKKKEAKVRTKTFRCQKEIVEARAKSVNDLSATLNAAKELVK